MLPCTCRKLAGCTLFITGASRGIGKAIALKAARDGANVVIAAKTAEPHRSLPGTIYTAAKEIEEAGGKALPCVVNVREEEQIIKAVEKAVKTFGAYTISKYGMSMCVLGMAEEFRGEVAVNALWPKTAIYTAAMDMLGGSGVEKQCRKTDILADAAYCILTKPKTFTGNFVIDETLLREEGVKDFDVYAIAPGHPLLPDFFLDAEPDVIGMKLEQHGASPVLKEEKKSTKPLSPVAETFRVIQGAITEDFVKAIQGVFLFELSGDDGGTWYIDLKTKGGSAGSGKPPVKADVVMSMSSADFVRMFTGKLKPTMAFMSGKLRISGNMALAMRLEKMLVQLNSKL
uniref:Hydroxysteroid dehydrogenase-like protein 2 n=1 Tax=Nothoprocta perdicaria TaxID=30464 RepID=A0A8C6ZKM7_NOTPE